MTIAIVTRFPRPTPPAVATARALAALGRRVVLLIAPADAEGSASASAFVEALAAPEGLAVHLLPEPRRFPPIVRRLARRRAVARALRRLGPQVVHLADEADRGIPAPRGAILLQGLSGAGGPPPRKADAAVTPDGRFLDRSGLAIACPGVPPPPSPSPSPVVDGLDPADAGSQWRALMYCSAVDQLRRARRARPDRPHAPPAPRSGAGRRATARHPGRPLLSWGSAPAPGGPGCPRRSRRPTTSGGPA